MITIFENFDIKALNKIPNIGDYVQVIPLNKQQRNNRSYTPVGEEYLHFLSKNCGRVIGYIFDAYDKCEGVKLQYFNIPKELESLFNNGTKSCRFTQILAFAKTIEEVELKINANKYNL